MTSAHAGETSGIGLARALAATGHEPPVLVVADTDTISGLALAWLESFDEVGWLYRVRSFGGVATESEIEALAAEARSLGARVIAAIGDATLIAASQAAAARAGADCRAFPHRGR